MTRELELKHDRMCDLIVDRNNHSLVTY